MAAPPIPSFPEEGNYGNIEYAIGELRPAVEYALVVSQLSKLDADGQGIIDDNPGNWEWLDRLRADADYDRWLYRVRSGDWTSSGSDLVTYRGVTFYYADPWIANKATTEAINIANELDIFEERWRWLNAVPLADTAPSMRDSIEFGKLYERLLVEEIDGDVKHIEQAIDRENWNEEAAMTLRNYLFLGPIIRRIGSLAETASESAASYHNVSKVARHGVYQLLIGTIEALYKSAHREATQIRFSKIVGLAASFASAKGNLEGVAKVIQSSEDVAVTTTELARTFPSSGASAILEEARNELADLVEAAEFQFGLIADAGKWAADILTEFPLYKQAVLAPSEVF